MFRLCGRYKKRLSFTTISIFSKTCRYTTSTIFGKTKHFKLLFKKSIAYMFPYDSQTIFGNKKT